MTRHVIQAYQGIRPRPTGAIHIHRASGAIKSGKLGKQAVGVIRTTNRPDYLPIAVEVYGLGSATTQRRDVRRGDTENFDFVAESLRIADELFRDDDFTAAATVLPTLTTQARAAVYRG
jgi:hypothetical protein